LDSSVIGAFTISGFDGQPKASDTCRCHEKLAFGVRRICDHDCAHAVSDTPNGQVGFARVDVPVIRNGAAGGQADYGDYGSRKG
jgi:hypothetical protein